MKSGRALARFAAVLAGGVATLFGLAALAQVDEEEKEIHIASENDADTLRTAVIMEIWGTNAIPSGEASVQDPDVDPIAPLTNVERVESLELEDQSFPSAYHFIPSVKKNRLVIVHGGHSCSFDDEPYGLEETIRMLVHEGYGVLAIYMPLFQEGYTSVCGGEVQNFHDTLFEDAHPLAEFLDPTAKSLNYVLDEYPYDQDVSMLGISGGGWTTTLYAAVDPRIKLSVPVAGSIPLYMWGPGYAGVGDLEQTWEDLYDEVASYPELYVLGSYGQGRRQIQVLNRDDPCCFGENHHDLEHFGATWEVGVREYEQNVRAAVAATTAGSFEVVIDETIPDKHTISDYAIQAVIRPALGLPPQSQVISLITSIVLD
jgi:pimeloyl-ACP methyl ester carboxylesterase